MRGFDSWFPVLLWTFLIFFLSSLPKTTYSLGGAWSYRNLEPYLQYPAHLIEYTALALLWFRALLRHPIRRRSSERITLCAILLTALADETFQFFIPTRSFSLRDLLMDASGGLLAVALFRWVFRGSGGAFYEDMENA